MINKNNTLDLSNKIKAALNKGRKKLIAETKAKNSYIVFSDEFGKIIKVKAKDL